MTLEIRRGVARLFRLVGRQRHSVEASLEEELRFHVEARAAQLMARGMDPAQALVEAERRLGGTVAEARDRLLRSAERKERRMARREWMRDLGQDFHYAVRGLARRPGLTAVATLTLAVGIGANTAIFSALDALLYRELPFARPDRLMDVSLTAPGDDGPAGRDAAWSYPKFRIYQDAQTSFADVAIYSENRFNLSEGLAERVDGEFVSSRYLTVLGIPPAEGRDFGPELDLHPGAERLVIVSDGLWRRRFGADPTAVGRPIRIDGEPFQILGILPPGFQGLSGRADLLIPVTTRSAKDLDQHWSLEFSAVGRLKTGVTAAQARSEAELLGPRIYEAYPMDPHAIGNGARPGWGANARPLDELRVAPGLRRSLLILAGAVSFVLLMTCVNLANLLLGRAAERRKEIAIRLAIGAGRGRLTRLLLTESVLLALLGGAASLLVAWGVTAALRTVNPADTLRAQGLAGLGAVGFSSIRLHGDAYLFTLLVALTAGVLFGLVPALGAARPGLTDTLKDDGAAAGNRFRLGLSRNSLVVTEVALAVVLVAGAGLMLRSLQQLMRVDPGFDESHLLTFRLTLTPDDVPRDSLSGFYDALLARMRVLPGGISAGLADCPPLSGGCNRTLITFPDRPPVPPTEVPIIGAHFVTPDWFGTMAVPLRRGRLFTDADRTGAPKVIVISESAARRHWPGQDPIGQRAAIWQGGFNVGATVVGVVGDVRFGTIDSLPGPDAYIPYRQAPRSYMMVFLRTANAPTALAPAARAAVHELAPGAPVYDMQTMGARLAAASAQARLSAVLFTSFAMVALGLAGLGIYGVMSFAVGRRTREIGIRMALGAAPSQVLGRVLREGIGLAGLGATVGLAGALALTGLLRSFLYEIRPTDPATFAGVLVLLLAIALLATWLPARRAARVDPVEALRRG